MKSTSRPRGRTDGALARSHGGARPAALSVLASRIAPHAVTIRTRRRQRIAASLRGGRARLHHRQRRAHDGCDAAGSAAPDPGNSLSRATSSDRPGCCPCPRRASRPVPQRERSGVCAGRNWKRSPIATRRVARHLHDRLRPSRRRGSRCTPPSSAACRATRASPRCFLEFDGEDRNARRRAASPSTAALARRRRGLSGAQRRHGLAHRLAAAREGLVSQSGRSRFVCRDKRALADESPIACALTRCTGPERCGQVVLSDPEPIAATSGKDLPEAASPPASSARSRPPPRRCARRRRRAPRPRS